MLFSADVDYRHKIDLLDSSIGAAQRFSVFPVVIIDDDLTENNEFFEVFLTGVAVNGPQTLSAKDRSRIQLNPDRAEVEIVDNDG